MTEYFDLNLYRLNMGKCYAHTIPFLQRRKNIMYMFKYIMKRLGLLIMTFSIIIIMCFALIKALPITVTSQSGKDTDLIYAQLEARGYIYDVEKDPVTGTYSYKNVPVMIQLGNYVKRIVKNGDFGVGVNMYANRHVLDIFISFLPPTILINIYSSLIGVPIGLALGIFAALKKNKWQDQLINIGVILLISLPSIVLGLLIKYFLCYKFPIFPQRMNSGYDYFTWSMFRSMLPAVLSLCLGSIAGYTRYTRAELTEVLTSEFMLLARTKGLTRGQATVRHALRNAMVPIFPMILGEFISVLSGSLIIENIFSIPGVGGLYLTSIQTLDYDFFMLLSGFYTLVGLLAGIIVDISYGFIDPRIRMGAK